jgi:hypothetical protein
MTSKSRNWQDFVQSALDAHIQRLWMNHFFNKSFAIMPPRGLISKINNFWRIFLSREISKTGPRYPHNLGLTAGAGGWIILSRLS